ncbi:MAG: guanylate kinase [Candidatus Acidiferrales bacterium]
MAETNEPLVLIVSGPSGSGKSTLVEKILELPGTMLSVSCTTRPPRKTESDGKWYTFISEDQFRQMVTRDEFLEYAQVFGKHWYGTPRKGVEEARAAKKDLVLEIDVQGASQVKKKLPRAEAILILPPSRQELERRLRSRGQDSDEAIARRLEQARREIECYRDYDYIVVNDQLDRAGQEVQAIVQGQRSSVARNFARVQEILNTFGGA